MRLEYLDNVKKSEIKSKIVALCLEKPRCSKEIAEIIYGSTSHYEETYISKILSEMRRNGFLEEIDYNKFHIGEWCPRIKANHYFFTNDCWMEMVKELNKRTFGTRKLTEPQKTLVMLSLKDRVTFLDSARKVNNPFFDFSFSKKKVKVIKDE